MNPQISVSGARRPTAAEERGGEKERGGKQQEANRWRESDEWIVL